MSVECRHATVQLIDFARDKHYNSLKVIALQLHYNQNYNSYSVLSSSFSADVRVHGDIVFDVGVWWMARRLRSWLVVSFFFSFSFSFFSFSFFFTFFFSYFFSVFFYFLARRLRSRLVVMLLNVPASINQSINQSIIQTQNVSIDQTVNQTVDSTINQWKP